MMVDVALLGTFAKDRLVHRGVDHRAVDAVGDTAHQRLAGHLGEHALVNRHALGNRARLRETVQGARPPVEHALVGPKKDRLLTKLAALVPKPGLLERPAVGRAVVPQ